MKIAEYKENVKRTCADLGSPILNSVHMVLGFGTELTEELIEAFEKNDSVNVMEELTDAQWYLANYANIWGFNLPEEYVFEPESDYSEDVISDILRYVGKLQDLDKKAMAYGKEVAVATREEYAIKLFGLIEFLAFHLDIDMSIGRAKNIAKLQARYPEKFDNEKAINRDHAAERLILEA